MPLTAGREGGNKASPKSGYRSGHARQAVRAHAPGGRFSVNEKDEAGSDVRFASGFRRMPSFSDLRD